MPRRGVAAGVAGGLLAGVFLSGCSVGGLPVPGADGCLGHRGGVDVVYRATHNLSFGDLTRFSERASLADPACGSVAPVNGHPDEVEVKLPGFSGGRAASLFARGHLVVATWQAYSVPDYPPYKADSPVRPEIVAPESVPVGAGGYCVQSREDICLPSGYAPKDVGITNAMVQGALAENTGQYPGVWIRFDSRGGRLLAAVTRGLVGQPPPLNGLAIFLDTKMLTQYSISQPLIHGELPIQYGVVGSNQDYRRDVAAILATGEVPVLQVVSEHQLG